MKLKTFEQFNISSSLKYHIENNIFLSENMYRYGSDAHLDLVNEVRDLYNDDKIELYGDDKIIVEKLQTGKKGIYKGEKVEIHLPFRITEKDKKKKYRVYHPTGTTDKKTGLPKVKKIDWGDPNLSVKNFDDKARKSFLARHRCHLKTDIGTSGWWACNVHLFWKQLGLSSNKPW